ncbi:hypothetical protein NCAS_0C00410 [Naumovozyma castellii]|uniref:Phosphoribomutase n=1 Tax=Naumovozyma castellii TaxID=27288 RepID=G0VC24_NAUCA|nr:hypothetical protein NCAS_0C00410 [Naumovozyma castellii CBS 4309]CCC69031.1 hypothetical protein NCAS_0C00410 [Naumovozyma castellii CBS 4309]
MDATQSSLSNCPENLREPINLWLRLDQNEETRKEVLQLCENKNWPELHQRFDTRIVFGTAGLRSRMEAGFSRMNSLIILQSTQGLANYIKEQFPNNLTAVVGHDHRFHSKEFAIVTASIFLRAGFKVFYLTPDDQFVHTPLVPFSVLNLKASVGVMITASHNPKMDNGYKVYYDNACQIIPPHDKNIAEMIQKNLEPWSTSWDWDATFKKGLETNKLVFIKDLMTEKYLMQMKRVLIHSSHLSLKDVKTPFFVYTPMHGVGAEIFAKVSSELLNLHENVDYLVVSEQRLPDPSFPTVSFPNPEEKGALSLAIKLAQENGLSLVIANDPDADRFSAAVLNKKTGKWRQLTGNEIGFLLGYYEFQLYEQQDVAFRKTHPLAMINSTVSSQMIKRMADMNGFHYEDTLTGFKWIGNKAIDLRQEGYYVPFGFEEAIGYMFPDMECDKDGISAATVFLQAYCHWMNQYQMSPFDIMEEGFGKFGVFKEYNGYYILKDLSITKTVFDFIRHEYPSTNKKYPSEIGNELIVTVFRDLTVGYQSNTKDNIPNLPVDPTSQMITVEAKPSEFSNLEGTVRLTMRGSGTEPKLKVYIEACSKSEESATNLARSTWDILKREWFRPEVTGLTTSF